MKVVLTEVCKTCKDYKRIRDWIDHAALESSGYVLSSKWHGKDEHGVFAVEVPSEQAFHDMLGDTL